VRADAWLVKDSRAVHSDRRTIAYTAAAMYGAAGLDGLLEGLLPSDPAFAIAPVLVVIAILACLLTVGPRLPMWALALLGPLGVGLTAIALATTPGTGDGAVLYTLPVLWTTLFFGRRGAAVIVACVALAHAGALLILPGSSSYPGRWIDVMVVVCAVALVVLKLKERNEALLRRLSGEARTDALTGLLNRRGFDERASLTLAQARREGTSLALVAFDIDYFKRINDEWGHDMGDRVLSRAGALLASHARAIDVVARMGGEEFTVLLPGADLADADMFSERVRHAFAETDPSRTPSIRVSAGVAACVAPMTIEGLLERADSALYEAKRSGRDRTVAFRPAGTATRPEVDIAVHAH
jgi:diguanylate cyclase (GGDEF)-like protein